MANRRMIYDSFYANADLNMLSIGIRHLYIGTIVLSDDDGKMVADPRYLKGRFFSCDEEISSDDVQKMLEKLNDISQIILYSVKGRQYLKHPNWKKYQHIRGDIYKKSNVPNPLRSRYGDVTEMVHNIDKDRIDQDKSGEMEIAPQSVAPREISQRFFSEESNEEQESIISLLIQKGIPEDVARREVQKFVSYWTELNQSGTKQRWQQEKTFEIKRRLATWFSRVNTFNGVEKQNKKIAFI